ncbi:glycosyl hydrolase [Desulfomarina profundi]|uniref:Glycosyl hydrolase n=1 Tax=Desulfomarina profundi TaxID=2772557 RepID=A0A8D5FGB2_9BACT|nr:glycoside hydrolase family 3 N-terminal domain-containing protein [Desulfomarina profundi]BCL60040.1 glycosyl hydrolase [Desulfomarina profundi]
MTSLKDRIGQLFIVGFEGASISAFHPIAEDIIEENLGGVILFDRLLAKKLTTNNIVSASQVQELTGKLREMAGDLLIAVDQEGGRVSRLARLEDFPDIPAATVLGEKGVEQTRQAARRTASALRSLGINFNLAPVADLDLFADNPIIGRYGRSFGRNPETVFRHCLAWCREHRDCGVLSCLKHFPGHGSSKDDSHLGFVDISESWEEKELQPFANCIEAGFDEAVMIAHLFHRGMDSELPATLSAPLISRKLKGELGFRGVVVTDDMQMRAITDRHGLPEACSMAIGAGADLVIIGNNLEHDPQIFVKLRDRIVRDLEDGKLTETRIEDALSRVLTLKQLIKE